MQPAVQFDLEAVDQRQFNDIYKMLLEIRRRRRQGKRDASRDLRQG